MAEAVAFGKGKTPESKTATNRNQTKQDQERGLEILIAILLAMGYGQLASLSLLSQAERSRILDNIVADTSARLIATTRLLMGQQITIRVWLIQMRDILVAAYAAAAMVQSGKDELNEAESDSLVAETNLQYGYLVGWYTEFREGRQQVNQGMLGRADLYARSVWAVAWRVWVAGKLSGTTGDGRRPFGLRVLGAAEHCRTHNGVEGCIELAGKGWLPLEEVTPIGATPCGPRCHCRIDVSWRQVQPS